MDKEDLFKDTDKVMMCDNCGAPVIQPEVDDNDGNCPNCNRFFQPFNESEES